VTSDYDPKVDFTRYKSFAFLPDKTLNNPFLRQKFENAITRALEPKGFRYVTPEENPDLWIAIAGSVDKQLQMDTSTYGYGYGGYGWYGGYGMGMGTTTVREIPVGTVVIDVVDAARKELVWQGRGTDTINPNASSSDRDYNIHQAMLKMFKEFPPKQQ
jgi:hypothetical protein